MAGVSNGHREVSANGARRAYRFGPCESPAGYPRRLRRVQFARSARCKLAPAIALARVRRPERRPLLRWLCTVVGTIVGVAYSRRCWAQPPYDAIVSGVSSGRHGAVGKLSRPRRAAIAAGTLTGGGAEASLTSADRDAAAERVAASLASARTCVRTSEPDSGPGERWARYSGEPGGSRDVGGLMGERRTD